MVEFAQWRARTGKFAEGQKKYAWDALQATPSVDGITFWTGFYDVSPLSLVYKALQFVQITTAPCERNWSIRNAIHTKVRNRLDVETASKLTFIKHNLLLEHANLFQKPKRRDELDEPESKIKNMSMSSTDGWENAKSSSKTAEKKLSSEFLLSKSCESRSAQASMSIAQAQTNMENQRNKSPESAWGCLCCLFYFFMSCYLVCPPIPSVVARKLAFNPPMRGQNYELNYVSVHGQIIQADSAKKAFGNVGIKVVPKGRHIGRKLNSIRNTETFIVKTRSNNHLVCLKFHPIFAESRDLIVIFAQPNACDIGELFGFSRFCETLRTDLCIFDYSGYGLSTGTASEENLYGDIQAVFDHVCAANQAIKVVLVGMSIGTAACVDLASKNSDRLAGVVLVAPFTSGCRLLRGEPGLQNSPSFDRFRSVDKIGYVEAPVLLIHGLDDVVIPVEHSKVLYGKLKRAVPPMFVPKATHSDVLEMFPDVYHRIRWFIEQEV